MSGREGGREGENSNVAYIIQQNTRFVALFSTWVFFALITFRIDLVHCQLVLFIHSFIHSSIIVYGDIETVSTRHVSFLYLSNVFKCIYTNKIYKCMYIHIYNDSGHKSDSKKKRLSQSYCYSFVFA